MRGARLTFSGVLYHVISRFVDRDWFFESDEERSAYLHYFGRAIRKTDWRSLAYCTMSNHIHHALIAGTAPFESLFKSVHSPLARWMNQRRDRLGPMFADRPYSRRVPPENAARLIAYIHNNPVRAGVVTRASESVWSSHNAIASGTGPRWLDIAEARARCGEPGSFDQVVDDLLTDTDIDAIEAIEREVKKRGAIEVGTPSVAPLEVPLVRRPYGRVRPSPETVVAAVADLLSIRVERVASRSKVEELVAARRACVHAGVRLGLSAAEVACALGVSRQAACRALARPLTPNEETLVELAMKRVLSRGEKTLLRRKTARAS